MIYLDPKRVARVFGPRPHLGRRIPITIMRHTGVEWRGNKPVPKPQHVQVTVTLTPVRGRPGFWDFRCDPRYAVEATKWLMAAIYPPKLKDKVVTKPTQNKLTPGYDYKQGRWKK